LIVLDMDPTVDPRHGHQQRALFNAFEDERCFMPFHVYEGLSRKLMTTVLHPGKTPNAGEILSVLKRIVRELRTHWPLSGPGERRGRQRSKSVSAVHSLGGLHADACLTRKPAQTY